VRSSRSFLSARAVTARHGLRSHRVPARSTRVDGITYYWHEYVLFNPYKGIRYLSEYNGHWNDITICKQLPTDEVGAANYLGETYKHFQTSDASTDFVLGEFPWQVRVGERAASLTTCTHPASSPAKKLDKEVTWSIGEYMYGREIWDAFKLPGAPPEAMGVYGNQPSPVTTNVTGYGRVRRLCCFLLALMAGFDMRAKKERSFMRPINTIALNRKARPLSSPTFSNFTGHTSTVEVKTYAPVSNHWIYLNYALINQDTGQAWDFGRDSELLFRLRQRWFLVRKESTMMSS